MHYSEDQWRRASPLFTWIRDPEADPAGRSFGERGGEYRDLDVVVIVDLGGLLVGVVALNAAGVLDETAFEGDRPAAQRGDSGHLNMQRLPACHWCHVVGVALRSRLFGQIHA